MFSLIDDLIESVEINGNNYSVDMSFDNIIRMHEALNDKSLSDATKIYTAIHLLFDDDLDMPAEEQVEAFTKVYEALFKGDEDKFIEYDLKGNPMPKTEEEDENGAQYDLMQDAEYIYSSFMQDYNIDLIEQQGKLHWYKFKALLAGLREDTKFKRVLEIRGMQLPTGKGAEKQRSEIKKLKKLYALKPRGDENARS